MDDVRRQIVRFARLDLARRLARTLEGQRAFEDISDLVGVRMDVPRQYRAGWEHVSLRHHLYAADKRFRE
jgi:hypothetical protein